MKLLIDAQLPPSLAIALRELGNDAQALREIGLQQAKDHVIWNDALEHNAAILTKDEDFAERSLASNPSPVVVWLRIGNATNPELRNWLMPLLPAILTRNRRPLTGNAPIPLIFIFDIRQEEIQN